MIGCLVWNLEWYRGHKQKTTHYADMRPRRRVSFIIWSTYSLGAGEVVSYKVYIKFEHNCKNRGVVGIKQLERICGLVLALLVTPTGFLNLTGKVTNISSIRCSSLRIEEQEYEGLVPYLKWIGANKNVDTRKVFFSRSKNSRLRSWNRWDVRAFHLERKQVHQIQWKNSL